MALNRRQENIVKQANEALEKLRNFEKYVPSDVLFIRKKFNETPPISNANAHELYKKYKNELRDFEHKISEKMSEFKKLVDDLKKEGIDKTELDKLMKTFEQLPVLENLTVKIPADQGEFHESYEDERRYSGGYRTVLGDYQEHQERYDGGTAKVTVPAHWDNFNEVNKEYIFNIKNYETFTGDVETIYQNGLKYIAGDSSVLPKEGVTQVLSAKLKEAKEAAEVNSYEIGKLVKQANDEAVAYNSFKTNYSEMPTCQQNDFRYSSDQALKKVTDLYKNTLLTLDTFADYSKVIGEAIKDSEQHKPYGNEYKFVEKSNGSAISFPNELPKDLSTINQLIHLMENGYTYQNGKQGETFEAANQALKNTIVGKIQGAWNEQSYGEYRSKLIDVAKLLREHKNSFLGLSLRNFTRGFWGSSSNEGRPNEDVKMIFLDKAIVFLDNPASSQAKKELFDYAAKVEKLDPPQAGKEAPVSHVKILKDKIVTWAKLQEFSTNFKLEVNDRQSMSNKN